MPKEQAMTIHVDEVEQAEKPTAFGPEPGELVERIRQVLVPVEPSAAFVRSLGRELVEASRRQRQTARRLRRGLVIGAAALGSAVSAGLVTLLLLRRRAHMRRPVHG